MSNDLVKQYTLAGETVDFPNVASGTAVKNSAKRFSSAWDLPPEAAFALATAMVDPAAERNTIVAKSPYEHLQAIQTPAGKFLLAHRGLVWTALVSGDGSNGRSRYEIQTANGNGPRLRPWPIGRHHKPAIIDYHASSLDDMIAAARISADTIRSAELVAQIARNPRGIWNPPVVVLARAYIRGTDGRIEERWFVHSIEGSTRVEGCHELTETDPGAPLARSDSPLDHLRDVHAQLVERFETTPTSAKTLGSARAAVMPALIVVATVDEDGTAISDGFPEVVNDYVESVHVQPRPFNDVAQSNVLGERFLLTLQREGRIDSDEVEALLGRSTNVPGKPTLRAAKIVHAVCDPANEDIVREFVITEDGGRLTKARRAKLIGPLVVRQFDQAAESADRALMRAFTPDSLLCDWAISGKSAEALRRKCLKDVDASDWETAEMIELMARGGPALCATGLLLSDQGSTVKGVAELRGTVDKVVDMLAGTRGGVNVLADAIAWADGQRKERPRQFEVEGQVKVDKHGDPIHFSTAWDKGNMGVRALAFMENGEIPKNGGQQKDKDQQDQPKTPEEQYKLTEQGLIEKLLAAQILLTDLAAAKDEQGRRLLPRMGLQSVDVYEELPVMLTKLYAKFGSADPLDDFDDDELPDAPPELDDDDDDVDEELVAGPDE